MVSAPRLRPAAAPALNDRQRAYLLAIFETDQETEAAIRSIPYRPFEQRPKASEWCWLEYSKGVPEAGRPATALYTRIKKLELVDQGTGSTFSALADRGLVEVNWHGRDVWGQLRPYVRLTPAWRRLGRSWTGAKAYTALPAGTLKEWHWRALARGYGAGDEGLEGSYGDYANIVEHLVATARLQAGRVDRRASEWLMEHPRDGIVRHALSDPHHWRRLGAVRARVGALP
jgi:hypothetical protein